MLIFIYNNKLLLFSANIDLYINNIIQNLEDRFRIIDLEYVSHYLRIKIDGNLCKITIIF